MTAFIHSFLGVRSTDFDNEEKWTRVEKVNAFTVKIFALNCIVAKETVTSRNPDAASPKPLTSFYRNLIKLYG